jgi:hypothetical protein
MLPHDWADALNRVGIVLGFASFWFAAPEFIGEQRLKEWEEGLGSGLRRLSIVLNAAFVFVTCGLIVFFFYSGVREGRFFPKQRPSIYWVILLDALLFASSYLDKHLKSILAFLSNDGQRRKRALLLGALLFTVSTILQLAATFAAPN